MKKTLIMLLAAVMLAACEKQIVPLSDGDSYGNVVMTFAPTMQDTTRGDVALSNWFTKLNVQLFDADGNKVFERVKTQTSEDDDFGRMVLELPEGRYTVVAVGHSSKNSATIKSPEAVQFTASDGEKLTDTFCHCSTVDIGGDDAEFTLPMYRVGAMVQFVLTDSSVPDNFAYFVMEYTGGSANFNPTTMQGITKSTQSERRVRNSVNIHQAFTFPYMATSCSLKMTVTATDADGTAIRQRVFDNVPVTRNRITTYTGHFFEEGDGEFTVSDFGFVVHADWDGEDHYEF